jgi:hypothetical protein
MRAQQRARREQPDRPLQPGKHPGQAASIARSIMRRTLRRADFDGACHPSSVPLKKARPERTEAPCRVEKRVTGHLRLEHVKETPIRDTGVIALSGRTYRGTVLVGLATRIYGPVSDDAEPSEASGASPGQQPGDRVHAAPGSRDRAAGEHGTARVVRPDRLQARPLIPHRPADGPNPVHTL